MKTNLFPSDEGNDDIGYLDIVDRISRFECPSNVAFVTIWWNDPYECQKLMSMLVRKNYHVISYRKNGETEIRFVTKKFKSKNELD